MTLAELLQGIREFYLKQLREVIERQRADSSIRLITEPVLRLEDGALAREGALALGMRVDLVVLSEGRVQDSFHVRADRTVSFKPFTFPWNERVQVTVGPFQWEDCALKLHGVESAEKLKPLVNWFDVWFDAEDERAALDKDLQGVVHCLTDPQFEGSTATLTVDFGTAPTEVFEDFLDAIDQCGATAVEVGVMGAES